MLLCRYFVRLLVPGYDCKFDLHQHSIYALKLHGEGLSSSQLFDNVQLTMIGMLGTVRMVDLRRRRDGGSTTIRCSLTWRNMQLGLSLVHRIFSSLEKDCGKAEKKSKNKCVGNKTVFCLNC
ncbi:hypothetical protein SASPL_116193 [Salvia splendens]|uniref:Uncharacterized protein n=1 Tax=Salvia splendens TaxID=180675 RepID=A0A8X8ZXR2_SALSN|nr:hypothetical protein SASPL_116193 [Salvia splendens]